MSTVLLGFCFFSSRRRHTRYWRDWSSDVCSSDLQEVIAYLWAATRRGEKINYASYEPLKEAIEKKLMNSVRDISRIITKARTRDDEQRQKYDAMVENLDRKSVV